MTTVFLGSFLIKNIFWPFGLGKGPWVVTSHLARPLENCPTTKTVSQFQVMKNDRLLKHQVVSDHDQSNLIEPFSASGALIQRPLTESP
jgi:hypothetical protein